MSGKFDGFVQKLGLVNPDDLQKPYKLRICKDRTLSISKGKAKPFNGVAIAVLSFNSLKQARDFIVFVGTLQWQDLPGDKGNKPLKTPGWYKFWPDIGGSYLEYKNLPEVTKQMKIALEAKNNFGKNKMTTQVFVGLSEIAEKCNVTKQAVANWSERHKDFPKPLQKLKMGSVWSLYAVEKWLKKNGKLQE